jgi:hypothetical protein
MRRVDVTYRRVHAMCRVLVFIVAAVLLGGCGDADVARERGSAVALTVADYRYTPQNVSVAHGQVFIALRNAGTEPTSFVIRRGERERGRISTLQPGEVGTLTVRLAPGEYVMGSGTGKHEVLGQYGTLTVR